MNLVKDLHYEVNLLINHNFTTLNIKEQVLQIGQCFMEE